MSRDWDRQMSKDKDELQAIDYEEIEIRTATLMNDLSKKVQEETPTYLLIFPSWADDAMKLLGEYSPTGRLKLSEPESQDIPLTREEVIDNSELDTKLVPTIKFGEENRVSQAYQQVKLQCLNCDQILNQSHAMITIHMANHLEVKHPEVILAQFQELSQDDPTI